MQGFDKMDSKIPASVKIEHPEVYVNYPTEDIEIQPCSLSCPSLQEESQIEKKAMFGNMDWKLEKQEQSHKFSKVVGIRCSIQEMAGHSNTETRMPEVTTALAHNQQVSFVVAENGYTASQHPQHCSHMSESVPSMIEINTKLLLPNENCQLDHAEIPVKQL
ncbi:hypothetical protein BsWGS_29046 [Bradybaena similaris]